MKRIKKMMEVVFVVTICCAVMSLSNFTFVNADERPVEEDTQDIDQALRERHYPQVVLDTMDPDCKKELYEDSELYFDSADLIFYDQENGEFESISICDDGIAPIGQISTSDLTLNWTISKYKCTSPENGDGLKKVNVRYSYKWEKLPACRWQDIISVTWDTDVLDIGDESFYKVDKYSGFETNSVGVPTKSFKNRIQSEEKGYAKNLDSGIAWYADLRGYRPFEVVNQLNGYARFDLIPKEAYYKKGSSVIFGHYVHPTAAISLDIYDNGALSLPGGYDERGNQKTVSWEYK